MTLLTRLSHTAVAFSGGPDSLALLFLLQRHLKLVPSNLSLVSFTVNHHLQAASDAMTDRCRALSESLGVENISVAIPWSHSPFPPPPLPGAAIETIARNARFQLIFDLMRRHGCDGLVMGHHADDQVETLLMRMAVQRDSSSGRPMVMRSLRRWGMGHSKGAEGLGWAGLAGMETWILRPLLDVSKVSCYFLPRMKTTVTYHCQERLVATCQEHGLGYVQDATNFDPALTQRNAFRAALSGRDLVSRYAL